jgi:hypothetical protein
MRESFNAGKAKMTESIREQLTVIYKEFYVEKTNIF